MQLTNLLILAASIGSVVAFPISPGTCGAGPAIAVDSAGNHGAEGSGDIFLEGISLNLNGIFMIPFAPTTVPAGEKLDLTIAAPPNFPIIFKGFLYRLSANDGTTDVSEVLSITNEDLMRKLDSTGEVLSIPPSCAEGVSGIGHKINLAKKSITTKFMWDGDDIDLTLETTVVLDNRGGGKQSWVYTRFPIKVRKTGYCSGLSATSATPVCNFQIPGVTGGISDIVQRGAEYFSFRPLSNNYFALSNAGGKSSLLELDLSISEDGDCSGELVKSCDFSNEWTNLASISVNRVGDFFIGSEGGNGSNPRMSTFNDKCEEVVDLGGAIQGQEFRFPPWYAFGGNTEPLPGRSFESITQTPNTIFTYMAMEGSLTADNGGDERVTRVSYLDNIFVRNVQSEFIYVLDKVPKKYDEIGLTSFVAMDDWGTTLAIERSLGGPNARPIEMNLYQTEIFTSISINNTAVIGQIEPFNYKQGMDKDLVVNVVDAFDGIGVEVGNIESMAIVGETFGDDGGLVVMGSNQDNNAPTQFYVMKLDMEVRNTVGSRAKGLLKEVQRFGGQGQFLKLAKKVSKQANKNVVKGKKVVKATKKFRSALDPCPLALPFLCGALDFFSNQILTCFLAQEGDPFQLPEGVSEEDAISPDADGPPGRRILF